MSDLTAGLIVVTGFLLGPVWLYFCVKLVTFAFFRAKRQAQEKGKAYGENEKSGEA